MVVMNERRRMRMDVTGFSFLVQSMS
jgi:hypothetical protein